MLMELSIDSLVKKIGRLIVSDINSSPDCVLIHSQGFKPQPGDSSELFQIFDQYDQEVTVLGRKLLFYRGECHGPDRIKGFFHRGANVLFERDGMLYLPKRAGDKDLYPSCHEFSVGEHVKIGESYEDAAVRGSMEELGVEISAKDLKLIKKMPVVDEQQEEQVKYFLLSFKGEKMNLSEEVESGSWMSVSNVKQKLNSLNFRPDHFPAFRYVINNLRN